MSEESTPKTLFYLKFIASDPSGYYYDRLDMSTTAEIIQRRVSDANH